MSKDDPARDEQGRWVKGASGNPSGRPKQSKEARMNAIKFRNKVAECSLEYLDMLMKEGLAAERSSDRIAVLKYLIDQGVGRAAQYIEWSGDTDGDKMDVKNMSSSEILARLDEYDKAAKSKE